MTPVLPLQSTTNRVSAEPEPCAPLLVGSSMSERSRSIDCSAAKVSVAAIRSGVPARLTALARIEARIAEPPAARNALSTRAGIGDPSVETLASE
jgi:hypothetical protein